MAEKTLILVIGCHRSGTSAVMGCLYKCGVKIHDHSLVAPDNPKGFFEAREVLAVHNYLLASVGATWDNLPKPGTEFTPEVIARALIAIRDIIRTLPGPVCAVKDPRATLFVPFWKQVCEIEYVQLKLLYVHRRRAEVVASLCAREGWKEDRALELVRAYGKAADAAREDVPSTYIIFPDEIEDESEWRRVFSELEVDVEPCMGRVHEFIDPNLIHHQARVVL